MPFLLIISRQLFLWIDKNQIKDKQMRRDISLSLDAATP